VIHIRLRNHSRHRLLDRPLAKLIQTMLIPNSLKIKVRAIQKRLEEGCTPSVRDARIALGVLRVSREDPAGVSLCIFIAERLHEAGWARGRWRRG
jgi:hypothetical protein